MTPDQATAIAHLTGANASLPRPAAITAPGGGGKFAPDGSVLEFPGNTFICHIPKGSAAHAALVAMQATLQAAPFARHFTFLPPASLHMTVFEGVCMSRNGRSSWPEGIPEDAELEPVTTIMAGRLAPVVLPRVLTIRPTGPFIRAGLGLSVVGADGLAEATLRKTRQALKDALRLDPPGFAAYPFHISLAYLLDWLPVKTATEVTLEMGRLAQSFAANVPVIRLDQPEFCTFQSMHHFEPLEALAGAKARPVPGAE